MPHTDTTYNPHSTQRQPCTADGLQCGEQRHHLPLIIFWIFRLQKCQKKCIFAVKKKIDESSRTDNESGITNPKTQLRWIANPPQLDTYSNYKYNPGKYTPEQSLLKIFQR